MQGVVDYEYNASLLIHHIPECDIPTHCGGQTDNKWDLCQPLEIPCEIYCDKLHMKCPSIRCHCCVEANYIMQSLFRELGLAV